MGSLGGKTVFITGASRGIGKAIGLRLAREGANVVIAAKSATPHPKLPGTIFEAAEDMEQAGGRALALAVDIRHQAAVQAAVERAAAHFGGIDILINNASAISLAGTLDTPAKRFDLMFAVNVRGTYLCSRACIPYLTKSDNPHILNLAPPLNLSGRWFKDHLAYTMSKYGMSMCVLGMAEEFCAAGIAVNALWPRTVIATAALAMLGDRVEPAQCRRPEIVADAAFEILRRDSRRCTGNFFIDEEVLAASGIARFDAYAVNASEALMSDLFLDG